jgi:uncharacterized surface protein with fasciclin (FAS1) repeats
MPTIAGWNLIFSLDKNNKYRYRWKRKFSYVTIADVHQSYGVIIVIDKVLMPK